MTFKPIRLLMHVYLKIRATALVMVMVVGLIGLAEEVDERANEVKAAPAHVEPVEALRRVAHEKVENQVGPGAHQ